MTPDSAAIRDRLVAGIRRHRPSFEAAGNRAEQDRTLPAEMVGTLRDLGIFWLKTPASTSPCRKRTTNAPAATACSASSQRGK
jgi:hypothetical protein